MALTNHLKTQLFDIRSIFDFSKMKRKKNDERKN